MSTRDRHGPQIDLIIRGLNRGTGRSQDRFRVSAETDDPALIDIYKAMVRELARRIGGLDVLRACVDGRFGIAELHQAYASGVEALTDLMARRRHPPLAELIARYLDQYTRRSKTRMEQRLARYLAFVGEKAEVGAFTRASAQAFLGGLQRKRWGTGAASNATRNRYAAALHAFGTWLVDEEIVTKHPMKGVAGYDEGARRVRYFTPDEYHDYFAALTARETPEIVTAFKVLAHTGADVGEVVRAARADGEITQPVKVRDLHFDRDLPRILFKRNKVDDSPERLVPVPAEVARLVEAHVQRHGLTANDEVFGMLSNDQLRRAHDRARAAIGRRDVRRKDLRHVAAVLWRKAGVDLDRIREWLGHASIEQTTVYSGFGPDDQFDAPAIQRVTAYLTPKDTDTTLDWRKIA